MTLVQLNASWMSRGFQINVPNDEDKYFHLEFRFYDFHEQLIDLDATNFNGIYNVKVFLENGAVVNKKLVSY